MQNQMPQNSSNLQPGATTNLQPNRSDLQTGQQSDFLQREGGFDQQSLPIQPGKLRVGTTQSSTQPAIKQEASSDIPIVSYAITAGIVLLFFVALVLIAIKSSGKPTHSNVSSETVAESSKPEKSPPSKKKKQPRRKRSSKK
jgi:hypothetical protein